MSHVWNSVRYASRNDVWKRSSAVFGLFKRLIADLEYYRGLTGDQKLQILLELITPENPDPAIIERSARVHPLTEHEEC